MENQPLESKEEVLKSLNRLIDAGEISKDEVLSLIRQDKSVAPPNLEDSSPKTALMYVGALLIAIACFANSSVSYPDTYSFDRIPGLVLSFVALVSAIVTSKIKAVSELSGPLFFLCCLLFPICFSGLFSNTHMFGTSYSFMTFGTSFVASLLLYTVFRYSSMLLLAVIYFGATILLYVDFDSIPLFPTKFEFSLMLIGGIYLLASKLIAKIESDEMARAVQTLGTIAFLSGLSFLGFEAGEYSRLDIAFFSSPWEIIAPVFCLVAIFVGNRLDHKGVLYSGITIVSLYFVFKIGVAVRTEIDLIVVIFIGVACMYVGLRTATVARKV